jgi:hypothetical protein
MFANKADDSAGLLGFSDQTFMAEDSPYSAFPNTTGQIANENFQNGPLS